MLFITCKIFESEEHTFCLSKERMIVNDPSFCDNRFFKSYINNGILIERTNIDQINYRLGHDDDRQKSNYFHKNENGHVNNKKSKITIPSVNLPQP